MAKSPAQPQLAATVLEMILHLFLLGLSQAVGVYQLLHPTPLLGKILDLSRTLPQPAAQREIHPRLAS